MLALLSHLPLLSSHPTKKVAPAGDGTTPTPRGRSRTVRRSPSSSREARPLTESPPRRHRRRRREEPSRSPSRGTMGDQVPSNAKEGVDAATREKEVDKKVAEALLAAGVNPLASRQVVVSKVLSSSMGNNFSVGDDFDNETYIEDDMSEVTMEGLLNSQ
mmetsp:Transcript_198/g.457  ORF Transcript_198/g.457 Transcript_198/m.457 type:complete len:160 (-) Transcript_198:105-584(-)